MSELKTYRVLVAKTYNEVMFVKAQDEESAWLVAAENDSEFCAAEYGTRELIEHSVCEVRGEVKP